MSGWLISPEQRLGQSYPLGIPFGCTSLSPQLLMARSLVLAYVLLDSGYEVLSAMMCPRRKLCSSLASIATTLVVLQASKKDDNHENWSGV